MKKKPNEIINDISQSIKKCLDELIVKHPNINMSIEVGGMKSKDEKLPYIIDLDIDSVFARKKIKKVK